MSDMLALMRTFRERSHDPVLQRIYERAAVDVITEAVEHEANVWDPAYNTMSPEERESYINDCALSLAPILQRAGEVWAMYDVEPASDWLAQHRAG